MCPGLKEDGDFLESNEAISRDLDPVSLTIASALIPGGVACATTVGPPTFEDIVGISSI